MKKVILLTIFAILLSMTFVHRELCNIYKNELYIKRQALLSELLSQCSKATPAFNCAYFISQEIAPELLKFDHKRLQAKMCIYD